MLHASEWAHICGDGSDALTNHKYVFRVSELFGFRYTLGRVDLRWVGSCRHACLWGFGTLFGSKKSIDFLAICDYYAPLTFSSVFFITFWGPKSDIRACLWAFCTDFLFFWQKPPQVRTDAMLNAETFTGTHMVPVPSVFALKSLTGTHGCKSTQKRPQGRTRTPCLRRIED